jgi:septal ring factor EnvC (AmiA/AmiB activator)
MRAFARIVLCGVIASSLVLGVAGMTHAANYMYPKTADQLLADSQQREADLAKKLAQEEAANAALQTQLDASSELNKSLSDDVDSLTSRLSSAEASMAVLAAANGSGDSEIAALEKEVAALRQAPTAGPFDFSDSGHALVALTALLTGMAVAGGAAFALRRKKFAGSKTDTEPT